MCGEFQLSDVILIQGFLCSCDRNKSSKCYRRVHGEVYKGISWEDEPVHQSFLVVLQSRLTSDFRAKRFTCFGTCFQANRGGRGGGGRGGCRRKVETICGNCFSTCVNLKELFLGSLWGEQNGTKHSWMEKSVLWWNMWVQEWHSTELRKHSKKTWKECEKHEHVSCLLFIRVLEEKQKKYEAIILRERDDCELCWFYSVSHFWGMPRDVCWPEIFLKFQNPHTPRFFLICWPKFCSFVQ